MKRLNVSQEWVEARIVKLPYLPEGRKDERHGHINLHYPPQCFRMLERQARDMLQVPLLSTEVTIYQAAEELGRLRQWVLKAIERHNLPRPRLRRAPNNRLIQTITQATLRRLGQLQLTLPPPDYWSLTELHRMTGWPKYTITSRLKQAGYEPSRHRSPTGQSGFYYPALVISALGQKPGYICPAGNWQTAWRMGDTLNRSSYWMAARLARPIFVAACEPRLDDGGVIRRHYAPWVLEELKQESDAQRQRKQSVRRSCVDPPATSI